jgi:putative transposase
MPRPPRNVTPGGIYHITARGNRRQRIFLSDEDREIFLSLLARAASQLGWNCHAYCLMENHYHLVMQTPETNLSTGLQWLNSRYAALFNAKYGLTGHLFQGRFHSVAVESDSHLLELSRYLATNPVRAGLCTRPEDWTWGSYGAVIGSASPPHFLKVDRVLDYWGSHADVARENFRGFVLEALVTLPRDLAA